MMKPVVVLTTPLSSVMLPALARSVHDRATYSRILLIFQHLLAAASFPAAVGLALVARDTMLVLGGSEWDEAGRLLEALAITVLAQGFINMAATIFVSIGRWRAMFVGLSVMCVVLMQGLAIGLALGRRYAEPTLGIAWGYSLTTCLALFLPYMIFCLRLAGRRYAEPTLGIAWGLFAYDVSGALLAVHDLLFAAGRSIAVAVGPPACPAGACDRDHGRGGIGGGSSAGDAKLDFATRRGWGVEIALGMGLCTPG